MTMSMKLALDLLRENNSKDLSLNDLGFILTVFRDNEMNDDYHKLFQILLEKFDYVFED